MKKLTLDEIGKLSGVSRATVSRVINGYPHIRPELRERVQAVIDRTSFQPNAVARSLASSKSSLLGLFIPSVAEFVFADPYLSALIPGISRACNQHEYTLALFLFHSEEEEQRLFRRILGSSIIDGLIVTADRHDRAFLPTLMNSQIPFVLIGRPAIASDEISFVDSDNYGGAFQAVQHLINLGHERIGLISTRLNTAAEDRTAGYHQALYQHNLPFYPELVAEGDFTERSGYLAMQQLLTQQIKAVFIASDTMAIGALRAIQDAKLSVPQDIAVVSFDDLPSAANAYPPLTTIHQSIHQAGSMAVDTLMDVINHGGNPPRHIILPTELIVRASCGALQS